MTRPPREIFLNGEKLAPAELSNIPTDYRFEIHDGLKNSNQLILTFDAVDAISSADAKQALLESAAIEIESDGGR